MDITVDPQLNSTHESQTRYAHALERINRSDFRKAMHLLVEALQIAPDNPHYLSYFGLCIANVERDFPRAIRYCREALDRLPTDPILYVNLGKVYRLRRDNATAHSVLLKAWSINKRHPAVATELVRMGIRRRPFVPFLSRSHWVNKYFGMLRATLERRLVGHRMS